MLLPRPKSQILVFFNEDISRFQRSVAEWMNLIPLKHVVDQSLDMRFLKMACWFHQFLDVWLRELHDNADCVVVLQVFRLNYFDYFYDIVVFQVVQ